MKKQKWVVKQTFNDSGRVTTRGPFLSDITEDYHYTDDKVDIWYDTFDTEQKAQEFIDTELTE